MVKRLEATIKLEYDDRNTAAAIADAVAPDNLTPPAGLLIQTASEGCCVLTVLKAKGKLVTFISTIDDLLSSIATAERILITIKKEDCFNVCCWHKDGTRPQ